MRTKLIHYRPSWKRHWPNPYLEKKKVEHFDFADAQEHLAWQQ